MKVYGIVSFFPKRNSETVPKSSDCLCNSFYYMCSVQRLIWKSERERNRDWELCKVYIVVCNTYAYGQFALSNVSKSFGWMRFMKIIWHHFLFLCRFFFSRFFSKEAEKRINTLISQCGEMKKKHTRTHTKLSVVCAPAACSSWLCTIANGCNKVSKFMFGFRDTRGRIWSPSYLWIHVAFHSNRNIFQIIVAVSLLVLLQCFLCLHAHTRESSVSLRECAF